MWAAISIIGAAGLATFLALFLTSRPFDPANASLGPQQSVPVGPSLTPSPKTSASPTPTPTQAVTQTSPAAPGGETAPQDDAAIQSRIDKVFAADPILQATDVSTLVENGRVTIVGSVRSAELKQKVERTIRALPGVTGIDNQLVIAEGTP